jgi:MATE family multidrug resistance protein
VPLWFVIRNMKPADELLPLLKLAGPVILAEIGWMSMGIVDTMMVGPLGPAAIAATGLGSGVFTAIAIFGMGLMLGLDPLVSQAYGAGNRGECVRWLRHGVWLAVATGPVIMALTWLTYVSLDRWGLHPEIQPMVQRYLRVIATGAWPLLLYSAFRRYLQGIHLVRPIMFALVSANLVNAAANWLLIYGNLGFPALGVEGSAWATTTARAYMATFLYVAIRREHRAHAQRRGLEASGAGGDRPGTGGFDIARMRRLIALGFPAAGQITVEVGVFAAATALAGKLDPVSSGSHQIALNLASLAFMVPLGVASSSAVRVGFAIGAGDPGRAARAGWTALAAGAAIMVLIGAVFFFFPVPLLRAFTSDPRVLEIGGGLLAIAAAFQLFDGTQAVATGVLRGSGDTRTPMIVNIIGHWVLGLPVGYLLCFVGGWNVAGLWIGLSTGLVFVSAILTIVWWKRAREMQHAKFKLQM